MAFWQAFRTACPEMPSRFDASSSVRYEDWRGALPGICSGIAIAVSLDDFPILDTEQYSGFVALSDAGC